MKTIIISILAIVLFSSCQKTEINEIEETCYICTDIEARYLDGKLISKRSIASYKAFTIDSDTLKTNDNGIEVLIYMDCKK